MKDLIVIVIIIVIVGLSGLYIFKAKKSGRKCIGCPDSKACSGNCSGCSCKCNTDEE